MSEQIHGFFVTDALGDNGLTNPSLDAVVSHTLSILEYLVGKLCTIRIITHNIAAFCQQSYAWNRLDYIRGKYTHIP